MPNTPSHILYHGKATGKDKAGKKIWTRVGAAWPNKSGKGFNLTWEYLPLGEGITVMLPYDKDDAHASPPEIEQGPCAADPPERHARRVRTMCFLYHGHLPVSFTSSTLLSPCYDRVSVPRIWSQHSLRPKIRESLN
jgi:hypothetical protein